MPKSQNELLPEGWKELVHNTGMVLYCHLPTRVVTWSRPYFLADRFAKVPVTFRTIIFFILLFATQLYSPRMCCSMLTDSLSVLLFTQ